MYKVELTGTLTLKLTEEILFRAISIISGLIHRWIWMDLQYAFTWLNRTCWTKHR